MFLLSVRCCSGCLLIVSVIQMREKEKTHQQFSPEKFPWNKSLNANEKKTENKRKVWKKLSKKWNEMKLNGEHHIQFKWKWLHKMTMNYFFDTLLFSFIIMLLCHCIRRPIAAIQAEIYADLFTFIKHFLCFTLDFISPRSENCLFCISQFDR